MKIMQTLCLYIKTYNYRREVHYYRPRMWTKMSPEVSRTGETLCSHSIYPFLIKSDVWLKCYQFLLSMFLTSRWPLSILTLTGFDRTVLYFVCSFCSHTPICPWFLKGKHTSYFILVVKQSLTMTGPCSLLICLKLKGSSPHIHWLTQLNQ